MIDIIAYLLPLSGNILLDEVLSDSSIHIEVALIPESFQQDCQQMISRLEEQNIPYRVPSDLNEPDFKSWVKNHNYDVGASVGYDKKLPPWLINYPTHGTLNIHPSLLPQYRGANPYFWVLRNREANTGVTLHYMDEEFDTGPIIEQEAVSIEENETMGTLFFLLNRLGVEMLQQVLDQIIETGNTPASMPQEEPTELEPAPKVRDRHLRIDWEETKEDIDALVRAGNPFFGAYTTFRGATLKIFNVESVSPYEGESDDKDKSDPGSVITTEDGPIVRCDDGWLKLNVVQMEQYYKSTGKEFQKREKKAFNVLNRMI